MRKAASQQGFDLIGIAPAVDSAGFSDLARWIDDGYAADMAYFADRLDAYRHPSGVLPGAKSILVMTLPYANDPTQHDPKQHDPKQHDPTQHDPTQHDQAGRGRLARYTWQGTDYHDVIHPKLKQLVTLVRQLAPHANARGVVDTAPIMEREIAQLAGLGWRGKNTLLLNKHRGSYFFLACLLLDIELPYSTPHVTDHCGTCTACLDACPTQAFPRPGVLDASKCISYLTIEHRDIIPTALRDGIGDWVFGCDVCQEVCPWNQKHASEQPDVSASAKTLDLVELFSLDDDAFRKRFRKTPLWRTRRRGVLRNAAIVLGNQRHRSAVEVLSHSLDDIDPIIRGAVAWALGKIGCTSAAPALANRLKVESDEIVQTEIGDALRKFR
ncbi:tRNA epoxyqueuosine(34) reductase QueG [Rubripirellula amarantea]|nr:tRNA epoxyqueuosine(34) reductase QueG [Rubripirellula amarantea]